MGPGAGKHVSPWQPQAVLPQLATSCSGPAATPSPGVCPGLVHGKGLDSFQYPGFSLCDLEQVACSVLPPWKEVRWENSAQSFLFFSS